jgi:hypothetical protein
VGAIAAVVVWCSTPTALAAVSPHDATSTRDYLRLELAQTRGAINDVPRAISAVEALSTRLQEECPGVLANAPTPASGTAPTGTELEIDAEEADAALGAAEDTEYVRARGFAKAVAKLRWSDPALTRIVRVAAAEEAEKEAIAPPNLCADMRAWVSSGYQAVSAATPSYLRREGAVSKNEGAQQEIMRRLARYENPADKRIAHQITDLEKSALPALLTKVIAALDKVSDVLHTAAATPAT